MAEAAERFMVAPAPEQRSSGDDKPRHLRLADQSLLDAVSLVHLAAEPLPAWFSADDLPSLRAVREQSEADAQRILNEKRALNEEGRFDKVGYAFDVLSTARKVITIEETEGKFSNRYRQADAGFTLDCQRHRDEARRRMSWEYFPEVEQPFDDKVDSFVYGSYVTKDIVEEGLTPVGAEKVGEESLVSNYKEEHASVAISKLGKLMLEHAGVKKPVPEIRTITASQIETSPQVMVWAHRHSPTTNSRFIEQIALPKKYITHEVIVEALKRKGSVEPDAQPTQQEVNDTQSVSLEGEGVLKFAALLDEVASELSGKNILMGEEVPEGTVKDYASIPAQAAERQAKNPDEVKKIKAEVLRLARNNTDGWHANRLIEDFVTDMLFTKVIRDPVEARHIFGEKTAQGIEESMALRQQGDNYAANRMVETVRAEAPRVTVCSGDGGACELQKVNLLTAEGQKLATAVCAKAGDTVLTHANGKCPNPKCGKRGLLYAYNSSKVNKKCLACGLFESKVKIAPKAA